MGEEQKCPQEQAGQSRGCWPGASSSPPQREAREPSVPQRVVFHKNMGILVKYDMIT